MVGFDKQRIAARQHLLNVWRGFADIGEHTQPTAGSTAGKVFNHQLRGLTRIVRHRKTTQPKIAQRNIGLAANLRDMHTRPEIVGAGCPGAMGGEHWNLGCPRKPRSTAHMIVVLMGHKNRIKIGDGKAAPRIAALCEPWLASQPRPDRALTA